MGGGAPMEGGALVFGIQGIGGGAAAEGVRGGGTPGPPKGGAEPGVDGVATGGGA